MNYYTIPKVLAVMMIGFIIAACNDNTDKDPTQHEDIEKICYEGVTYLLFTDGYRGGIIQQLDRKGNVVLCIP